MAYQIARHPAPVQKKRRGGVTKLFVCTVVFFIAVLLKITGVPGVAETLSQWIGQGTVEESLAVLGMSLTDLEQNAAKAVSSFFSLPTQEDPDTVEVSGDVDVPAEPVEVIDTTPATPDVPFVTAEALPTAAVGAGQVSIETLSVEFPPEDAPVAVPDESEKQEAASLPLPDVVSAAAVTVDFPYVTPVNGVITSPFGYRDHPIDGEVKFHYGVDVRAAEGTKILAFADGVVNTVLQGEINGNYLKIGHDDGIVSMYAHCKKILVKAGDVVKKGDVIAYVGETGKTSGPHLHFQLYKDGKIIDPTTYFGAAV